MIYANRFKYTKGLRINHHKMMCSITRKSSTKWPIFAFLDLRFSRYQVVFLDGVKLRHRKESSLNFVEFLNVLYIYSIFFVLAKDGQIMILIFGRLAGSAIFYGLGLHSYN